MISKKVIDSFRGQHYFLSNFTCSKIVYERRIWDSVEHAYQASKTKIERERHWVWLASSPGEAKKRGRQVCIREDWEEVKLGIMLLLVRLKFRFASLRKKLLDTGDAELVEGNWWGDVFWGVCKGKGENHLGKILMQVREEINDKQKGE